MMRTLTLPSRLARTSCSVLALATVLVVGATPAAAQSFQGTGTFFTNGGGVAGITTPNATTTNIAVNPGQTVINWSPFDTGAGPATIVFQNAGSTATFAGTGNFAVLNRINPADSTRSITMNGTIQTTPPLGFGGAYTGSIYFYSPGGFVLGASSIINVGSLVLSASPITVDGSGNFINGVENTVIFGQAPNPLARVVTNAGSQITASAGDAYVAMVAPRVDHRGSIDVSGSAALVGAEAATINFSPDGLFDIQVTTGTTDSQGVFTNGNITGSASSGAGDARRVFLVAVPKNTALTMAIGSGADLGFAIAGAANVSGNAVILSAGHNIVDGEIGGVSAGSVAGTLANLNSTGLNATSGVRAVATNFAEFYAGAGQANSFASDLDIRAPGRAWVNASGAGTSLTIVRDLVLNSDRAATTAGGSATGGFAALYTNADGTITVGRDTTVTANGTGANSSTTGIAGGTGTGGTAVIQNQATGGTINIIGNALVTANGTGGGGLVAGANGGAGTGGRALIRSFATGTSLTVGGNATAQAQGIGGAALGCVGCIGGVGQGGFATAYSDLSSTLSVAGMLRLNVDGRGGSAATGRGGTIDVYANANSSLSAGSLNASADGFGGADAGAGAGNGFGGSATLRATGTGSSIAIANVVTTGNQNQRDFISVEGYGGQTNGGGSGIGGTGTGGTLLIRGEAGGSITLPNIPNSLDVRIMARGYGGNASADGTTGGLGAAGTLTLALDNATLTAGPLHFSAAGLGGSAVGPGNITGGNGIGGTRAISAVNGSTLSIGLPGGVAGGGGGAGSGTGAGGNASGGTASLLVDNSTVNLTSRSHIVAQNVGGNGAIGGNASGGTATVTVRNGGIVNVANDPLSTDDLLISSNSFGGGGTAAAGNGGNASAGIVNLALQGGTINLTGGMLVSARAFGGGAIGSGSAGTATGGNASVLATGANTLITGSGAFNVTADAFGGSSGSGSGGNGNAGSVTISAEGGTGLTIQNSMTASASATGGNGATGGGAAAGNVIVRALTGGDLNLLGATSSFSTNATGGNGLGGGFGDGGDAYGWNIDIHADGVGSTLTIGGAATATANATGGSSESGDGGFADGGAIDIYAQNSGNLSFDGDLTALANAQGGTGPSGGGNAHGGEVSIYSLATLQVDGYLTARAEAIGGDNLSADYSGWVAGDAYGGDVDVYAGNGTLTLLNAVILSTNATGGAAANSGDAGGYGEGGNTHLDANAGGTVELQSSLTASASGRGGDFGGFQTTGGNGRGGEVRVQANGANASVTMTVAELDASGSATGGGSGTGGTVIVQAFGAATASLEFQNNLAMYATGVGGSGYYGSGGNAQGGNVVLQATGGAAITVGGNAWLVSSASGGYTDDSDSSGGNAVGGTTQILTFGTDGIGGNIAIAGNANVTADGNGGATGGGYYGSNPQGGDGTGGSAHILTTLGTITIGGEEVGGSATVSADGTGGYSSSGAGGDGFGGTFAAIEANGGDITIYGSASVSASGFGGDGLTGGDGVGSGFNGGLGAGASATLTGGAHIFARNGDIIIGDGAIVSSTGTGGDGGSGGYSNGYDGDYGGDGTGGFARILAQNSDLGPSSITIVASFNEGTGTAEVNADGIGGDGGDGSAFAGGNGGNGGTGQGGTAGIVAAAGNGLVTIDNAIGYARGTGGGGGDGGNGGECFSCDGGNGGNGGDGIGGAVIIGTVSGIPQSTGVNNGVGEFGSIMANASAWGGVGGAGNFGSTNGDGGDGGDATGGLAMLLVRGSTVNVDSVTLTANATGGNAGFGYVGGVGAPGITGIGGNATVGGDGGIRVEVTDRFLIPAHLGTLNASDITGTAIAAGGIGILDGNSQNLGGSTVTFRNADGNIGSLDFLIQTGTNASNAGVDSISVINGDVTVGGAFSFVTSGNLSLFLDSGDLTANTIRWYADDFVPASVTPLSPGTFFAKSFDIQTDNNFITTAHLDSVQTLTIVAPGAIQIGNVTGDNSIVLEAQDGEVDIGNVLAGVGLSGGGIDIDASTFILTGNIAGKGIIDFDAGSTIVVGSILNTNNTSLNAGTSINVGAINSGNGAVSLVTGISSINGDVVTGGSIFADSGGDLFLGDLTAPGDIELIAVGDMIIGNALAGETIDLDAGGYIDGGNMTAGDSVYAEAGGSIDLLAISAGIVNKSDGYGADYNVGLLAGTTIDTGNINAFNSIGLGAAGNITTGTINAGNIFLVLGGGNMSFGTINSGGTTYLANRSMMALGGVLTDTFDPALILAAIPVNSGGSITLRGPVTTGKFVAAAGGTISGSTINSGSSIYASSGGNQTFTNLDAATSIYQRTLGTITENDLTAGSFIDIRSGGAMALGDLVAGDYIDLRSNNAIGLLTANAGETINFQTLGTLTGLTINAGNSVLAEAMGAIQLGAITAGITDRSIAIGADFSARFSSSSAITIGNVNAVGRIGFGTPTNLVTGNLTSGEGLMALVGGNMTSGAINAADYVYLANHSMSALGGTFATFNRAPILAVAPVATGGSINIGAVNTGRFEAAAGTTLTGTTIDSNGLLYATSIGDMTLGNLNAGNDVRLTSGGNIVTGTIFSGDDIALVATGSITTLDIFAYDDVSAAAGTTITTDDITGNSINLFAGGDITTDDLLTQNFVLGQGAPPLVPGSSISVVSTADIDVGNIDALDGVHLSADGSITAGTILADTFVQLYADGAITAGNINAGTTIDTLSGGSQSLANLTAGDWIELDSEGAITFGNVIAEGFDFTSGGAVTGGNINALSYAIGEAEGAIVLGNITTTGAPPVDDFSIGFASATSITVGNVIGTDRVGFATLGNLTTGNITAGSLFMALVSGNMVTGSITTASNGRVYIANGSMYATGGGTGDGDFDSAIVLALNPVPTGGSITINGPVTTGQLEAAAGTTLTSGTIVANGRVALSSGGAMQTQAVTAGTSLRMTSGSTINGGNLTAQTSARVSAAGAVNVGNITITNNVSGAEPYGGPLFDVVTGPPVEVFGASIATGNIATPGYVGLYTPGSLTVGTITAGHDVIALVGTNAAFGEIKTPERFFLGGYSMFALANGGESFNPALVFGAPKAKTGGSASFAGASTAASFQAYVGTDTTLQSLQTSGFALIDTGGMFSLNGTLGGNSRVISNDIALGATSAINGEVHLTSRNATQTLIGDGLDTLGQGYRLSDAEADRINAVFTIAADTAYGAAAKMIIGDLSINVAASSGRNLEYGFGTVNGNADAPSVGSIKVVGDVTFTGLDQFDRVDFDTNLFQLDAATGSIALFSTGTTLGGTLGLFAPRIWVASGDILAKLEANSTYSGYIAELNAPAAVQRPEGVLRAGSIDIDSGEEALQSLLVQNTGTTALPAGFLTTTADIDGEENIEPAAGSVNLVINGQLITEGGTLTGLAVRDFLVTEFGSAAFVAGSTINGCVLVGPCGSTPPRVNTLVATDVQLTTNSGLGDGLFGNEGDIDDGESGDGGDRSSPISPPNPLFDSRPLVQSGDVDDPVSGAGNPSLYDDTSDEDAKAEDCDSSKDNNCKTGKKGDGK